MSKGWKKNNVSIVLHGGNTSGRVHTHVHIYAIWEKDTLHMDRFPGGYNSAVYIGGIGGGR